MAQNFALDVIKHIRKFDGKGFTTWRHNMEKLFTLRHLSAIVFVSLPNTLEDHYCF